MIISNAVNAGFGDYHQVKRIIKQEGLTYLSELLRVRAIQLEESNG